jgi:hypothetical protein
VKGREMAHFLALAGLEGYEAQYTEEDQHSASQHSSGDEGEEDSGQWESLAMPLPPTPSDSDAIAQWERAHVTDAQRAAPIHSHLSYTRSLPLPPLTNLIYHAPPGLMHQSPLAAGSGVLRHLFSNRM